MINKIFNHLRAYFIGFIHLLNFKKKNEINIIIKKKNSHEDKYEDIDLTNRIFESYKSIKKDQEKVNEVFKPSSLWLNHISRDYSYLLSAYQNDDNKKFNYFLNNFGNWKNYLGIEHNNLVQRYSKNFILRSFLENEIFLRQYDAWKKFGYSSRDLGLVEMPRYGNQIGAFFNQKFVTIGCFFNQIISKMALNNLHKDRPIIADLGGGYGKLGYFLTKNLKKSCFIDFDLPEVLVLASYYLMKTYPLKKTLLYGEKKFEDNDISNYDLIFMPSFEILKLRENSIDLFVNKNSLGEMAPETAKIFIEQINISCKNFFHMNHNYKRNIYDDGSKSLINSEYPINLKKFELVFDYPDISHFIYTGKYDTENDIFMQLYKSKL